MSRSDNRAALTDEVARFQAEVQSLALAVVRAVVQQELERKRHEMERKRPEQGRKQQELERKRQAAKRPAAGKRTRKQQAADRKQQATERKQQELDFKQQALEDKQQALDFPVVKRPRGRPRTVKPEVVAEPAVAAPDPGTTPPAPAPAAAPSEPPAAAAPTGPRKRVPWTRESIVNELANWMLSGTAIDATFVTRHGPPGLVAATRRVFGRFDAALNVAALHVSKLYPDGPPER
jgi:hypothetical protein